MRAYYYYHQKKRNFSRIPEFLSIFFFSCARLLPVVLLLWSLTNHQYAEKLNCRWQPEIPKLIWRTFNFEPTGFIDPRSVCCCCCYSLSLSRGKKKESEKEVAALINDGMEPSKWHRIPIRGNEKKQGGDRVKEEEEAGLHIYERVSLHTQVHACIAIYIKSGIYLVQCTSYHASLSVCLWAGPDSKSTLAKRGVRQYNKPKLKRT